MGDSPPDSWIYDLRPKVIVYYVFFFQKTVQAYPSLKRFPHMFPWESLEKKIRDVIRVIKSLIQTIKGR